MGNFYYILHKSTKLEINRNNDKYLDIIGILFINEVIFNL